MICLQMWLTLVFNCAQRSGAMSSSGLITQNFQIMTKYNKQQKLSDSTDTAIAYSTCYAPVPSSVKHPATYTESFIPKFAELLNKNKI
jgi:hypothetical protein